MRVGRVSEDPREDVGENVGVAECGLYTTCRLWTIVRCEYDALSARIYAVLVFPSVWRQSSSELPTTERHDIDICRAIR